MDVPQSLHLGLDRIEHSSAEVRELVIIVPDIPSGPAEPPLLKIALTVTNNVGMANWDRKRYLTGLTVALPAVPYSKHICIFLSGVHSPKDPLANPLYADATGMPPVYLSGSSEEALLDNSERFAAVARRAGG